MKLPLAVAIHEDSFAVVVKFSNEIVCKNLSREDAQFIVDACNSYKAEGSQS